LNLKEFLEKSTDPIFNEIPTPVIVNPVKDLVGCSTDFLTDCFPDNQFEVSLIDIPEMDPTSMIDTKKSLLLFNSNFPGNCYKIVFELLLENLLPNTLHCIRNIAA